MKKIVRKKIKIVIFITLLPILALLIWGFYNMLVSNPAEISHKPFIEYQKLFKQGLLIRSPNSTVKYLHSIKFKCRFRMGLYTYHKNKIYVYKVISKQNNKNLIDLFNLNKSTSTMALYTSGSGVNYKLSCSTDTIKEINLYQEGQTKKITKNDSIFHYYAQSNYFTISYDAQPADIIFEPEKTEPISVMFIKRDNNIYIVIMTVNGSQGQLSPSLLPSIINAGENYEPLQSKNIEIKGVPVPEKYTPPHD